MESSYCERCLHWYKHHRMMKGKSYNPFEFHDDVKHGCVLGIVLCSKNPAHFHCRKCVTCDCTHSDYKYLPNPGLIKEVEFKREMKLIEDEIEKEKVDPLKREYKRPTWEPQY